MDDLSAGAVPKKDSSGRRSNKSKLGAKRALTADESHRRRCWDFDGIHTLMCINAKKNYNCKVLFRVLKSIIMSFKIIAAKLELAYNNVPKGIGLITENNNKFINVDVNCLRMDLCCVLVVQIMLWCWI